MWMGRSTNDRWSAAFAQSIQTAARQAVLAMRPSIVVVIAPNPSIQSTRPTHPTIPASPITTATQDPEAATRRFGRPSGVPSSLACILSTCPAAAAEAASSAKILTRSIDPSTRRGWCRGRRRQGRRRTRCCRYVSVHGCGVTSQTPVSIWTIRTPSTRTPLPSHTHDPPSIHPFPSNPPKIQLALPGRRGRRRRRRRPTTDGGPPALPGARAERGGGGRGGCCGRRRGPGRRPVGGAAGWVWSTAKNGHHRSTGVLGP